MIREVLMTKYEAAQKQGADQRLLSRALLKSFGVLERLGLKDLTPEEILKARPSDDPLISEADRTRSLVLRTAALDSLNKPLHQITSEETYIARLGDAIRTITAPYYWLFNDKIPSQPRGIFSGKKTTQYAWHENQITPGLHLDYGFKINFTPKGKSTTLNSASIEISTEQDEQKNDYYQLTPLKIGLEFASSELSQLKIEWGQMTPKSLLALTKNTAVGGILEESFVFYNSQSVMTETNALTLVFTRNPRLRFEQHFSGSWTWGNDHKACEDLISWFEYNPGEDKFRRYFQNEDEYKRRSLQRRMAMSPKEFVDITRSALDLVPTIDIQNLMHSES